MMPSFASVLFLIVLSASGCRTSQTTGPSAGVPERELTPGLVQKEIHMGMSQARVAETLGSPNIVTRDADGRETWIYDKIATEASYSKSDAYGTILILGAGRTRTESSSTQRTLTVVIKFDKLSNVDSYTFHASKF
jgi:outer membrane protein assembly factor BamE (lipoprotein component of BamABCDE complex)